MTARNLVAVLTMIVSLGVCCANPVAGQEQSEMAHDGPAMNFLRIGPRLATGGHFADDGVAAISQQGVSLVIDLRDTPPEGQKERLAAAGIRWINVPVVWRAPRREDFEAFSRLMSENEGENILVQCQANYRASAFTYMYRVTELGVPESEARKELTAVWSPEGTWLKYMEEIMDAAKRQSGDP